MYFTAYETAKRQLQPSKGLNDKSIWVYSLSGWIADLVGLIIWVPMDLVKQRLQVQQNNLGVRYKNSYHAIYQIYLDEGIRGLYRGALIGAFSFYGAVYFPVYELIKIKLARARGVRTDELNLGDQLAAGFSSGIFGAAATCPSDVIKTQMQVYSVKDGGEATISAVARNLWKKAGIRAFYSGLGPRTLWIGGGTAITMGAYEQCKNIVMWVSYHIFRVRLE